MDEQRRLTELDRDYLTLKERESMLRAQLRELNTQQGQIGLKIINIEQEMQILEGRIANVWKEREDEYKRRYDAGKKKARGRKGKR